MSTKERGGKAFGIFQSLIYLFFVMGQSKMPFTKGKN
jgi:hypothetical protein